jgi:hypothetical protein
MTITIICLLIQIICSVVGIVLWIRAKRGGYINYSAMFLSFLAPTFVIWHIIKLYNYLIND